MEWLSILLVLICPIMMLFMMKSHGGHNHNRNNNKLDERIIKLENENKELHRKLNEHSPK
ncbi:DUF2933 domain-containing protein [Niallia sp. FSL R7-0271]|uniref:DUF2933 domain-containing protein n=1 Tax=Niallia sp. FSL R7-0271 TaxID=2921678 RepID=UPI0030F7BC50